MKKHLYTTEYYVIVTLSPPFMYSKHFKTLEEAALAQKNEYKDLGAGFGTRIEKHTNIVEEIAQ